MQCTQPLIGCCPLSSSREVETTNNSQTHKIMQTERYRMEMKRERESVRERERERVCERERERERVCERERV